MEQRLFRAVRSNYEGLNLGSGGAAVTFAGFTLSANAIGGRVNEQGALVPQNGAPELAFILGLKYVAGPLTLDIQAEEAWDQGQGNRLNVRRSVG